jgi:hypothetical protein
MGALGISVDNNITSGGLFCRFGASCCQQLPRLKQFKLVANLIILVDAHPISKIFSKEAQSDANLIIDILTFTDRAKQDLIKLMTLLGPAEATRRLPSLLQRRFVLGRRVGTYVGTYAST